MKFLSIGVFLAFAGTVSARELPRFDYIFVNGSRLVATYPEESGHPPTIRFETKEGRAREILSGRLIRFPFRESTLPIGEHRPGEVTEDYTATRRITVFETNDGIWFATQGGVVEQLPVDLSNAFRKRSQAVHATRTIEHAGREYFVISFRAFGENNTNGETYIIRDDGKWLRHDLRFHSFTSDEEPGEPIVQDGILRLGAGHRRIDLEHFDGECRFTPSATRTVLDGEGTKEVDPVKGVQEFFRDLVADARKRGGKNPTLADDDTMLELRAALLRPEGGSAVILGEAGSGKSQLLNALAEGIAAGRFPEIPRTVRLVVIDAATLVGGTKFVGTFEQRIKTVAEAAKVVPLYLVLDEMHALRGAGTHSGNQNDFFEFIKTALSEGSLRAVGTSNQEKFFKVFAGDPAILRRFTPVMKQEPKGAAVLPYLRSWLKRENKRVPEDSVLTRAVALSEMFNAVGAQPAKTTSLLATAIAWMELTRPQVTTVDLAALEAGAQKLYGVDPAQFDPRQRKQRIAKVEEALDQRLVGLGPYKRAFTSALKQYYVGIHEPDRPAMRIWVSGPPGNGKTEVPKVGAKALGWGFKRIEMTRYAQSNPAALLAEIAQALRERAFTVFVLDEFDWAHPDVQSAVLGLMDSGSFTVDELGGSSVASGMNTVRVSAKNAFFVLTSNAGTGYLRKLNQSWGFHPRDARSVAERVEPEEFKQAIVQDGVSPAVLSRCPEIVPVLPSTRTEFLAITALHFRTAIAETLEQKNVAIEIAGEVAFFAAVAERYYRENMDNRLVHQAVQHFYRLPLADYLLDHEGESGALTLHYDAAHGTVRFAPTAPRSCEQTLTPEAARVAIAHRNGH